MQSKKRIRLVEKGQTKVNMSCVACREPYWIPNTGPTILRSSDLRFYIEELYSIASFIHRVKIAKTTGVFKIIRPYHTCSYSGWKPGELRILRNDSAAFKCHFHMKMVLVEIPPPSPSPYPPPPRPPPTPSPFPSLSKISNHSLWKRFLCSF